MYVHVWIWSYIVVSVKLIDHLHTWRFRLPHIMVCANRSNRYSTSKWIVFVRAYITPSSKSLWVASWELRVAICELQVGPMWHNLCNLEILCGLGVPIWPHVTDCIDQDDMIQVIYTSNMTLVSPCDPILPYWPRWHNPGDLHILCDLGDPMCPQWPRCPR
jgi:hypothetical protein